MTTDKLIQLIDSADVDDLRELVRKGIKSFPQFKTFSEQILCPPFEDVDFSRKLHQAVDRETQKFHSRYDMREATDWSNVYYDLIKPWSESAETLSDEKLYDLIKAIIKEVAMNVTEEDFYGDDWYDDDFSGDIASIMDTLSNLVCLLMIREKTTDNILKSLKKLIQAAREKDIIDNYIGSPYDALLEIIDCRIDEGKVSCKLFDSIIEENPGDSAGEWICREIDFLKSKGLSEEARKIMEEDARYPEVSLKHYSELLENGDWKEAIRVLDKTQDMKDKGLMYYSISSPNWLELKQAILLEHGTLEERIKNLQQLFLSCNDKSGYYTQLKELVKPEDWKDFYRNLLGKIKGYGALDAIAPFLIGEGEFEWLYRLVSEAERKDSTDYRTPLKYAGALRCSHLHEMESMLSRTVEAYAADRFPPKKKVNSSKYSYFREDLSSLSDLGYADAQKRLVGYLLEEYRFRPSLVKELRTIKLR